LVLFFVDERALNINYFLSDVGDMLSFAFRSFSVEADLTRSLVSSEDQSSDNSESREIDEADVATTETSPDSILAVSMSGLVRPLKSRILQVISSLSRRADQPNEMDYDDDDVLDDDESEEATLAQNNTTNLLEVCGLLQFYRGAVVKGLEKIGVQRDNPLSECLTECFTEGESGFEASVRVYAAMLDSFSMLTGDSETFLVTSLLDKLNTVRKNAPGFGADNSFDRRTLSPEWVMETLFKATECKNLDDTMALTKCVRNAEYTGLSTQSAEELFKDIETKQGALIQEMVAKESKQVLELCGLGGLAESWIKYKEATGIQMATYPGLSQQEVEAAMKEFYESLYAPQVPSLETSVGDPAMRKHVRQEICAFVRSLYRDVYKGITSDTSYGSLSFLGHTPEQVDSLFTV
jgi:conserved oligomeric Golgi complex subunit 6